MLKLLVVGPVQQDVQIILEVAHELSHLDEMLQLVARKIEVLASLEVFPPQHLPGDACHERGMHLDHLICFLYQDDLVALWEAKYLLLSLMHDTQITIDLPAT